MEVIFYTNHSTKDTLNKTLIERITLNATEKYIKNITSPTLILSNNDTLQNTVNYAYIPEYNRYYFIEGKNKDMGGTLEITLRVDVLMSFKNSIRQARGILDRSTVGGSPYLVDEEIKILSKIDEKTINFPNSFSQEINYVLTTFGG